MGRSPNQGFPTDAYTKKSTIPSLRPREAMEAISGRKTLQEIASDHAIQPIPVPIGVVGWLSITRAAYRTRMPHR